MSSTAYRDPNLPDPYGTGVQLGMTQPRRHVSWGALFGGVVLIVAPQLLLSLLGAGIGFGGYVSAWLAGSSLRLDGVFHGLITWGVATLLTVWLLTSAVGGIISGGASALGGLASAAGSGVTAAAQPVADAAGITPDMVQQQAQAYLQPANPDLATMSPQDAQKQIATNLVTYAKGGPDAAAAKQRIVAIMAAQQKIPADQAQKQFDDAQAKLQQAKAQAVQEAKQAADASAAAASKTSFGAFATFLIGAIAAAIGGALASARHADPVRRAVR